MNRHVLLGVGLTIFVGLNFIFPIFAFGKILFFNPVAVALLSAVYQEPTSKLMLSEYAIEDFEFSVNSPFVLFDSDLRDLVSKRYDVFDSSTHLLNLKTGEVISLSPHNSQPSNSSLFSPTGQRVLFVTAEPKSADDFSSEKVKQFELFVYDTSTGQKKKLSSSQAPFLPDDSAYDPVLFGWLNERTAYYYCPNNYNGAPDIHAYCLANTETGEITRKIYSYGQESEVLGKVPLRPEKKEISVLFPHKYFNSTGTGSVYKKCLIRGWDGCDFLATFYESSSKKIFLSEGHDGYYWGFDNKLYRPAVRGLEQLDPSTIQE